MKARRVVVTGMGALTPIGNNVNDYWDGLVQGRSGAAPITYFDTSNFRTKFACELKNFTVADHLDRKEVRINDPYVQYALVSTEEALQDSKLDLENIDLFRTGVIWGTGNGGFKSLHDGVSDYVKGGEIPHFNPYFIPRVLVNMAAGIISIKYGIKGLTICPVTACATSNSALIEAYNHIRWDDADVIITGGSDAPINESGIGGFNACRALSTRNDDPQTASRPFDRTRDGFVMGEGSGTLILEEYEHALSRGAKIYAEVGGGAMTSDAYHLTATHPEGEGAVRAINSILNQAGLTANDIDYINCHATSTQAGDTSELKALNSVFHDSSPLLSSTKSMTGHLLGAAGAIEAIASIKAISESMVPPTINTTDLENEAVKELNIVMGEASKRDINTALSNTFGFGGHNAIVLFKKLVD